MFTKFRTETALIALSNNWDLAVSTLELDRFERADVTCEVSYTSTDRISFASLVSNDSYDEIVRGSAGKLAGVRGWLTADEPATAAVTVVGSTPISATVADEAVASVRVSARVIAHLSGSQAWQNPDSRVDALSESLMAVVKSANPRKDGSVTVKLTEAQRSALRDYAEVMAMGAADHVVPGETDALAELNAARALVVQIDKLAVSLV